MVRLDGHKLRDAFRERLLALGVVSDAATHVSETLVQTSLRGVDSHGIQLFPHYVNAVGAGRIKRDPRLTITRSSATTATMDADQAFGHHAGAVAMDLATDLALESGTGAVAVRNSSHFGAAAYFALRAAERGCLGFSFTNADALVKAFNARSAVFGTNPVCFAAPLTNEAPLCLDMATSQVSWNKVRICRSSGTRLGEGWAFDSDGKPTADADDARSLSPTGGYKGYGLGMMVEILCGFLANGPVATEILPMFTAPIESPRQISHFFMAIDIARFVPLGVFKLRLQGVVDSIRAMPHFGQPVMVPGDPEKKALVERSTHGIPTGPELAAALNLAGVDVERLVLA